MSETETKAATGKGPADRPDVEVRPTVFVGVGGTGMEVLLRLRRRILQTEWNGGRINNLSEFPVARFLYFDTDTNEARETGRSVGNDPMAEAVSFAKGDLLQAKVNIGHYQKNKRNYPAIDEWLPSRDLSRIDTEKGAGQVRAISRLLFFDQFDTFRAAVAEKGRSVVANVSNAPALEKLGLKTQQNLRVVVVASMAGGTGSGAFIDIGLAISSMVDPKPDQVDLFMVLPGGYIGANRDRVFANTFAASSELEHVMRPNPNPAYVKFWTSVEQPQVDKPYSDVFFFDTRNLNNDATGRITDVFDMMADILFEDFGNSDFARRKRSVAVNQQQHKMRMFNPPLSDDFGRFALSYSRGYSSIGQSIVATTDSLEFEAGLVDAGRTMLEAFFGVASGRQLRKPTPQMRDEFMANNLDLKRKLYSDFPQSLRSKPQAIVGYTLIDRLLAHNNTGADVALMQVVDDGFQKIRESIDDPEAWLSEATKFRDAVSRDVEAQPGDRAGARYGLHGERIVSSRQTYSSALRAENGDRALQPKLYALLDDQENAGLDYTIELIQEIRTALAAERDGVRATLSLAEQQFRRVADQIASEELADSLSRLEQAAKKGLFGNVDRKAAEKFLSQVQDDLKASLKFRMRALAAKEALSLLEEIASFLGEKLPAEENGEPRYTGLLREFTDGYASVTKVMALIEADARRVRDAVNRQESGAFFVIDGIGKSSGELVDSARALEWAREAFHDFGGCRQLFEMLKTEAERLKVLNQLRTIAKSKLKREEDAIPTALDSLRAMPPEERRKTFEQMLARATPWIHGDLNKFRPGGDQYKMIIAVKGSRAFQDEFGGLLSDLMPKHLGISSPTIEESDVPGRVVCYCELSGYPLNFLASLHDDWRKSYEKEASARDPLPLHNHEDYLRFPSPVVPSLDELKALREDLNLFLRGVVFGLLERRPGRGEAYQVDMSLNDWQRVGSERTIRRKRFDPVHRRRLEELCLDFESKLEPLQTLAAATLFKWTADHAYAPRREVAGYDRDLRHPGIANKVANELAVEFLGRFQSLRPKPALKGALEDVMATLEAELAAWTHQVHGSLDDVEHSEANRDPTDSPEMRAVDKRAILRAQFREEVLSQIVDPQAAPAAAPPPPPPGGAVNFYVAIDGQTAGPFDLSGLQGLVGQGRLGPQTQVFDVLTNGPWVVASACASLAPLFRPPPPPPAA